MSGKTIKSLRILGTVLGILILALLAAVLIPKLSGKGQNNTITLIAMESPEEITLKSDAGDYTFLLKDGIWVFSEDESYPVMQNRITRITDMMASYTTDKIIGTPDTLSSYGLDPAVYTVAVKDVSGAKAELKIGNSLPDNSGFYALCSGTEGVCVVPNLITYYLGLDIYAMLDPDKVPSVTEADQVSLTISGGGLTASFTQEGGSWFYLAESGEKVKEEDLSFTDSDGESHTIRKYLNDAADCLPNFRSAYCVNFNCSEEQLKEMGLTSPITVTYIAADGTETVYQLGNRCDNEDSTLRYLMIPGNKAVYLVSDAEAFPEVLRLMGY